MGQGRARTLAIAGVAAISIGASSAVAAGGAAPAPQGLNAAGDPPPPKPRPAAAAKDRRVRSFAGQDAATATRTAGSEFPEFVQEKAWTDLRDRPGVEVKEYVAPQTALVEAEGKTAVVQSQLPLSVETPDGLKAVDADLVADGERSKCVPG